MPKSIRFLWGSYFLFLVYFTTSPLHSETSPKPVNTVLWISVDGFRADYLEKAETPFLDETRKKSAWTDEMWPVFPSVTFPSHVSQATGTYPQEHGIVGNTFYDLETQQLHRFPHQAELLEAEPIWITAERQGVRSAVFGWPLSHAQTGDVTASHFGEWFDGSLSDQERLDQILDTWEKDENEPPLQLLLSYTTSPDREGHNKGPDAPEVREAVERIDNLLKTTFERAIDIWEKKKPSPDDQLFLILSSDHGMAQVHTLVHPEKLTELEDAETKVITTGNIAHIYVDRNLSEEAQTEETERLLKLFQPYDFVSAWKRNEIPEKWHLHHPTRTGDLFLVLDKGYTFNRRAKDVQFSLEGTGRTLGMHGYDPAKVPEMRTPLFIRSYPNPISQFHLGKVDAVQLHATVARILDIEPAPKARRDALNWEMPEKVGLHK